MDQRITGRVWLEYKSACVESRNHAVNGFYFATKPNSLPCLDTLIRLCNAFGITLAQFFMEDEQHEFVSAQEKLLIEQYRKLPDKKKKAVPALLSD